MASKKVGALIKEARTNAGLTQEKLADKVTGLSASDISKAERGEKELTRDQLKEIAKATGVTQKSLLDAATGRKSSSKTTGKTAEKGGTKTTGKTAEKGDTKTTAKKTSSSGTSMKVSASEKKLVELYREADSTAKKRALSILKGEQTEDNELLNSLLGGALEQILKEN